MSETSITTRRIGSVLRVTLARPERRNALDDQLVAELHAELVRAETDPVVRVIVLDGAGSDFCAGADLNQTLSQTSTATPLENLANAQRLGDLFIAIRRLDKVVIAAVRGRVLAGGAGLATACDMVVAAADVELGYPEVHLGLVPAMVGAMLRRSVGEKIGLDLFLTGRRIDAAEALRLGLINRVVPTEQLEDEIERLAAELAGRSPSALTLIKRLYYGQDGMSFEAAIERGAEVNVLARSTAEAREGIARFLDRRKKSGA